METYINIPIIGLVLECVYLVIGSGEVTKVLVQVPLGGVEAGVGVDEAGRPLQVGGEPGGRILPAV